MKCRSVVFFFCSFPSYIDITLSPFNLWNVEDFKVLSFLIPLNMQGHYYDVQS